MKESIIAIIKEKKIKFTYKKIGNKGSVRYFTCPFCGRYQIDDGGNYLCWTCEDGNIKPPIPEWRTRNAIDWKQ